MKFSPLGVLVVFLGAFTAIIFWVVGYFGLPNADTHRDLANNKPVQSSVTQTGGGGTTDASSGKGQQATWYSLDKQPKTLDLNITTENTSNPMNFNDYSKGALKILVPVGWKVNIHFVNKQGPINHSVGFVPWSQRESATGQFTEAFAGSVGPKDKFSNGVPGGQPYDFSFTADKAGQYAMVCGVPGHAAAGMWDEFDVDATATAPAITTDKGTITVS